MRPTVAANKDDPEKDDPLLQAFRAYVRRHRLIRPGERLVLGVSGGADSVCLLHLTLSYARQHDLEIVVAHLDHSLRPSSATDATFVRQLTQAWNVPLVAKKLLPEQLAEGMMPTGGVSGESSLESRARIARYRFLAQVATETDEETDDAMDDSGDGPARVAVGHTQDDQAETVLLNLLRGAGLDGLGGMRPNAPLPEQAQDAARLRLVRPLLFARRLDIEAYLQRHQIPWREDPTNVERTFTRNWLRHEILPRLAQRNPNIHQTLARTADLLAAEADRAAKFDKRALDQVARDVDGSPPRRVVLHRNTFQQLALASQRGVLRQAWALLEAPADALSFDTIESLRRALLSADESTGPHPIAAGFAWSSSGTEHSLHSKETLPFKPAHPYLSLAWQRKADRSVPVPGQLSVSRWLLVARLVGIEDVDSAWRRNRNPWKAYFDYAGVDAPQLTVPSPGMQIAPLGMDGSHKTLGDLFTDEKIPPYLRSGWPIVVDKGVDAGVDKEEKVLWVCGLRQDHHSRITDRTEEVLVLTWQELAAEAPRTGQTR